MNDTAERGPNYDWKLEAKHYEDEARKLRDLLHKMEISSEQQIYQLEQEVKLLRAERDYLYGDLIGLEHKLGLRAEIAEDKLKELNKTMGFVVRWHTLWKRDRDGSDESHHAFNKMLDALNELND